jgi:hypothetical protein
MRTVLRPRVLIATGPALRRYDRVIGSYLLITTVYPPYTRYMGVCWYWVPPLGPPANIIQTSGSGAVVIHPQVQNICLYIYS